MPVESSVDALRRVDASAPIDEIEKLDRELKFLVRPSALPMLGFWLSHRCRPDGEFPHGIVWSIYFDTSGLQLLDEKINSDYLKTKVRVRWYADPATPAAGGPAFIEAKFRYGGRRLKVRLPLTWTGTELREAGFGHPALREVPDLLRREGVALPAPLVPIMLTRYDRRRLVEPVSAARVSLDREITLVAVNRRALGPARLGTLPVAVLEVKGGHADLPEALHPVTAMGVRKASFSKYLACYRQALVGTS